MSRRPGRQEIREKIEALEKQTRIMEDNLREKIKHTYKSLSPVNLLRSGMESILTDSGKFKDNLLGMALKLGLSYIGGRMFWYSRGGLIKKLIGAAMQLGSSSDLGRQMLTFKTFLGKLFTKDKKTA
ncbi:MAG: hypothetical protein H3C48_07855 [Chitinophagaceae bacterium]|nr:hypothetical protein [Chitinophagaceae bacterium]